MGKIWKSARKQHKTVKEKYRDGMKQFRESVKDGEWSVNRLDIITRLSGKVSKTKMKIALSRLK